MGFLPDTRTLVEWHQALAHLYPQANLSMGNKGKGTGINISDKTWKTCSACATSKVTKAIEDRKADRKAVEPSSIVSGDIAGEIKLATIGGRKYTSLFIDHYSFYSDIELLFSKETVNVLEHFKKFQRTFERQTGVRGFINNYIEYLFNN